MGYSIKKAQEYLNNTSRSIKNIDILDRIYGGTLSYKRKSTMAGTYVSIKTYKGDPYFINFSKSDFEDIGDNDDNNDSDMAVVLEDEDKQEVVDNDEEESLYNKANIKRANQRRINKIKNIIRSNSDIFDKFLTLTLGNIDYREKLNYSINKYSPGDENDHPVPPFHSNIEEVLEKLSGVKKIDRCDESDSDRLNPEDEQLRKEIIDYLGNLENENNVTPKSIAQQIVENKYEGESLENFRFNEQVKLELQRHLDSLICSKDPYDTQKVKKLLANFTVKINRLLEECHPDSDKFKYLWVLEFQENEKIHFHILCNLPYIDQWELQKKWGEGMVYIKKVEDIHIKDNDVIMEQEENENKLNNHYQNIMNYLVKKIKKTSYKLNLNNEQIYSISEGLKKPISIINAAELNIINNYLKENNYKASEKKTVVATSEHGRSFSEEIYYLDTDDLYKARLEVRRKLVSKMIELAKKRNLDEITDDIFEEVVINHSEELKKEYFPSTR